MKNAYPPDIARAGSAVQKHYDECLANGCTPRFAEMLALQEAPRTNTDREFFAAAGTLEQQFRGSEEDLQKRVQEAKRRGYKPGIRDVYIPELAKFPGDPEAFFKSRADVKRLLEKRDWDADGAIKNKRVGKGKPKQAKKLADSIVNRKMVEAIRKDPSLKLKDKRELREAIVAKHGAKS